MFCASCGVYADDSFVFCRSCGAPVGYAHASGGVAAVRAPTGLVIGAIVCSVLALVFIPPILGGIGIYLGSRVRKANEGLGTGLMVLAGVCTVVGVVFGALIFLSA